MGYDLKPQTPRHEQQWSPGDLEAAVRRGAYQDIEQARTDGKLHDLLHGLTPANQRADR